MADDQRLARELRFAAAHGEITARFQAQVDVRGGLVVALEALSRWRHPRLGVMLPSEFVPLAEAGGAINTVGDVMIEAACRYGAALAGAGRRIEIAVNVAAAQLTQLRFAERVVRHLEISGLPAALLTLELTESRPAPRSAVGALAGLRAIGVGVSVDDVRTVEEAEARTDSLPFTELKVDRTVIQRLPDDRGSAARLLGFARDRGLQTVAEGVETKRQWEAVRELGYDRAQGYLFGHPLPPHRMTARLAAAPAGPAAQSEL